MNLDHYELQSGRGYSTFQFISEGRKGKIIKIIQFQLTKYPNLYNLAFGDKNESGEINDLSITDNGDAEKTLTTVVEAIYIFSDKHPGSWIYATGSTEARTRLYRMGINKYLDTARTDFNVMGEHQNDWEWYEKGKDYEAFAVQRK